MLRKADVISTVCRSNMEKTETATKPIRTLRRTKSECSEDVADAIYVSSPEERRRSYQESLEHFRHSNARVR